MSPQTVFAEVAVEPVVEGETHRRLVNEAVEALKGPGLRVEPGPMSTRVSGSLDEVLHAVHRAHQVAGDSVDRVITTVRLETSPAASLEERQPDVEAAGP